MSRTIFIAAAAFLIAKADAAHFIQIHIKASKASWRSVRLVRTCPLEHYGSKDMVLPAMAPRR